jgi:hypothetical protein
MTTQATQQDGRSITTGYARTQPHVRGDWSCGNEGKAVSIATAILTPDDDHTGRNMCDKHVAWINLYRIELPKVYRHMLH